MSEHPGFGRVRRAVVCLYRFMDADAAPPGPPGAEAAVAVAAGAAE